MKACNQSSRRILLLLTIGCSLLSLVNCNGYMTVEFLQYNNHDSRCSDGTFCDTILFFNSRESACDPRFRLTADKYNPGGAGLFDYQQGGYYSDQDNIVFGSRFGDIVNPVVIAMNYNDNPGSIQITVTVYDKDTNYDDFLDTFSASLVASGPASRETTMYSQPMLHRLSVRYWYTCHNNYYGLQCNTYCQAHNDAVNGHYSCDANGQKVCLSGWIGAGNDCKTLHPCNAGVCKNDATCTPLGEGYACQCRPDYVGVNCEGFQNPCLFRNPCRNGATCELDASNQPICRCPPQFKGAQCDQDVNECVGSNPCSNDMPCVNTYGGFRCNCTDPHFSGSLCELQVCNGIVCFNNGTCNPVVHGVPHCDCPVGFSGNSCEVNVDDCASSPCRNGGNCTDGVASFSCECQSGYSGRTCERRPMTPNVTADLLTGEKPETAGSSSVNVAGVAAGASVGFLVLVGVGVFLGVWLLRHHNPVPTKQIPDDSSSAYSNPVYNNAGQANQKPPTVTVGNEEEEVYEAIGSDGVNQAYEIDA